MSGDLVQPQVGRNDEPGTISAPMSQGATTLLKLRLFLSEKIIVEFIEKPIGCCWTSGFIRHVQLTTHRLNYSEIYKKNCFFATPPSLRQVFLKDISEIAIDNYRRVNETWLRKLANFVLHVLFPIGGAALTAFGSVSMASEDNEYYRYYYGDSYDGQYRPYQTAGIVLLIIGILAILYSLFRKKAPQIIFGTRCSQMPALSITLTSASDRIRLLEEASALLNIHQ